MQFFLKKRTIANCYGHHPICDYSNCQKMIVVAEFVFMVKAKFITPLFTGINLIVTPLYEKRFENL